jgi:hypothetical protein
MKEIYSSVLSILDDLIILEEEGAIRKGGGGGADYAATIPSHGQSLSLMH